MTSETINRAGAKAKPAVTKEARIVVPLSSAKDRRTDDTATKVVSKRRGPSEQALNVGRYASLRVKGRQATIRRGFVRSDDPRRPPPVARLLVGGRGGEIRLKLYLSMLFIAVAAPYSTEFPARAWAEMFDLEAPADAGSRRVRDAIDWLERHRFVRMVRRPGRESEVFLLSDEGTGAPFVLVSKEARDIWIKLPSEFWAKGWVAQLSGRAVVTLLVLLDYSRLVNQFGKSFWIPPVRARELYSLSSETLARGTSELVSLGVVTAEMKYFKESPLAPLRRRKEYVVDLARIELPPRVTSE